MSRDNLLIKGAKMLQAREFEEFVGGTADAIAEALNDLNNMNIGLAKDKLYRLLKQSGQLAENIEQSKPFQIIKG